VKETWLTFADYTYGDIIIHIFIFFISAHLHHAQILEQEKHVLRRKLDNVETECEARCQEFHADMSVLRRELELVQAKCKLADKEKTLQIAQLTEQNQRLTDELKEVLSPSLNLYSCCCNMLADL
jgi:cell shape-determining protein MreC